MADYDVFLYFAGNHNESLTWDSEFSYCFNAVLNQILENPPQVIANIAVPSFIKVKRLEDYNAKFLRTFILILGGEDKSEHSYEPVRNFISHLNPEQKGNVLIVRRPQKRIDELPDFLKAFPTYNFYEVTYENHSIIEYSLSQKGIQENSFLEKITDLIYDLKEFLDHKTERIIPETRDNTIFIAEVSSDQYKNRERLCRELKHAGYHVVPNFTLPLPLKNFETEVRKLMENSILTVHIMGEQYGISPNDTDYSYPEIQNRIFVEISKNLQVYKDAKLRISRFVWIQSMFDPYEDKQIQYMKRLRRDINVSRDSELIQSTIYDLKSMIDQKFDLLRAPMDDLLPVDSGVLFIADDYGDIVFNTIREEFLNASLNFILFQNVANISNDLTFLMNEIKKFKNILVLNTKSNYQWLQSILNLLARSKGYNGALKPALVGIFSTSQVKKNQEFHTLTIDSYIYNSRNINSILKTFITKIKA